MSIKSPVYEYYHGTTMCQEKKKRLLKYVQLIKKICRKKYKERGRIYIEKTWSKEYEENIWV